MESSKPLYQRVWGALHRPEYVYNPVQVYRRLRRARLLASDAVTLAWGLPVVANPHCYVGRDIINLGVFDKVVPEAICRLVDPGECAVDAGANIGQNTSMMALAAGPSGTVYSIEPHPAIWPVLSRNVEKWRAYQLAGTQVYPVALGASRGTAHLHEPADFVHNTGCGTLVATNGARKVHSVPMSTLDDVVGDQSGVGVLKLDVEGYELEALRGATCLLHGKRVRDIVFEDYGGQPSELRRFLESAGYAVFALSARLTGPVVTPTSRGPAEHATSNFVASLEPGRTVERFSSRGWRCLRPLVRFGGQPL